VVPALALGDGLQAFKGCGVVYVIQDGRVAIEYTSGSVEANGLSIDQVSDHYLISDGTKSSLLAPGQSVPPGTKTRTRLNVTGCETVGQFEGSLSVTGQQDGSWVIEVRNGTTLMFSYHYQENAVSNATGGCSVQCAHGSCSCSAPGLCWCFCGLFGEPHCIHIGLSVGQSVT
jgi:hypothetical protein